MPDRIHANPLAPPSRQLGPAPARTAHAARLLPALLGAVLAGAAIAPEVAAQDPAVPTPALSAADCRRLLLQLPSGDAAYVPGVSASGEPVAPADLPPSADLGAGGGAGAFDEVEIRLQGEPVPLGDTGVAAELRPGTLIVNTRTGEVRLNGRPLTGTDGGTLARYCAALEKRRRP